MDGIKTKWAIANGLGLIPRDDQNTCHLNFDQPPRGWLLLFGIPRGIILNGT